MLTFGSLFTGAGGFDLGMEAAGLSCRFQVEIDRTALKVLHRRWPDVRKWDDVRNVGAANLEPVDVLIGGFPCQDLSVAGSRGGLAGERSGLFYELARIARELRPRLLVWENVLGLLSSDDGRDFARVLRHLADSGYDGGWRVLDAQYFGVPQRRRRVFGVFARRDLGTGCCPEILALRESVCGHTSAGGEAGPDIAGTFTARAGITGGDETAGQLVVYGGNETRRERGVAATLSAKGGTGRLDFDTENFVIAFNCKDDGAGGSVSPTLRAMGHKDSHANAGGQVAVRITGPVTHALTSVGADASEDGTGRGTPIVAYRTAGDGAVYETGETTAPLTTQTDPNAVIVMQCHGSNVGPVGTLRRGNGSLTGGVPFGIASPGVVRRLTPRECERLMGWPDDHTRYADDGKEIKDGPRYRLIGNGVAAPVAARIGRLIVANC